MTNKEKEAIAEQFTDHRTAMIRRFSTGATRSPDEGKPEYAGYYSPEVMKAFGAYMMKHQIDSAGQRRSCRNWKRGIDQESYMQSMFRHFIDVFSGHEGVVPVSDEFMLESLMAVMFNCQGLAHELLKKMAVTERIKTGLSK